MDRSAIEKLAEVVNITAPKTDVPVAVIPSGNSLVSLEKYMDAPGNHKALYSTTVVSEFRRFLIMGRKKSLAGMSMCRV